MRGNNTNLGITVFIVLGNGNERGKRSKQRLEFKNLFNYFQEICSYLQICLFIHTDVFTALTNTFLKNHLLYLL